MEGEREGRKERRKEGRKKKLVIVYKEAGKYWTVARLLSRRRRKMASEWVGK